MTTVFAGDSARRVVGLLMALGVAFLVLIGGGAAVYHASFRALDLVVGAGAIAVWIVVAVVRPGARPRSALMPALILVVAVFLLSSLTSRIPRLGLEYTGYAVLLIALYLMLVTALRDQVIGPRLLMAIPILCAVVVVAYVALVMADWVRFWSVLGHLAVPPLRPHDQALTYSNPSIAMVVAVLLLAATFGLVSGRRASLALAPLTIGVAVVSFLTGSRGGLVGLAAGIAMVTAIVALTRGRRAMRRLATNPRTLGVAAAAAAALLIVLVAFWPVVQHRWLTGGADLRFTFWLTALRSFADAPLAGIGPGMWTLARIAYTQPSEPDIYIPHAHNIEIQVVSEFGLAGVMVTAVGCILVARLLQRALLSADDGIRRWGLVAVFALAYVVGHQQLDVFANVPAVIFLAAIPVAVIDARLGVATPSGPSERRVGATGLGLGALALLLAAPALVATASGGVLYETAVAHADAGRWVPGLEAAKATVAADPELPVNQLILGLAQAQAGDLEWSEAALALAARADGFPISWVNLAAVQMRRDRTSEARASADEAFRLGRQHADVAFAVAQIRATGGDRAGAAEALGAALSRSPTLIDDPLLTSNAILPGLLPDATAIAYLEAQPTSRWSVSVMTRDFDRARSDTNLLGPPEREAVLALIDALEGSLSARDRLWAFAEADPAFPFGVAVAALGARLMGDAAHLDRYRTLAGTYNQFGTLFGRTARVHIDHSPGELHANESTTFYGVFTYGRRMPQDALVPWLATIVWE